MSKKVPKSELKIFFPLLVNLLKRDLPLFKSSSVLRLQQLWLVPCSSHANPQVITTQL